MAKRLVTRQFLAESATAELFGLSIGYGPSWSDRVRLATFAAEEADHTRIAGEVLEALGGDPEEALARRGDPSAFFGLPDGLRDWTDVIGFNLIGDRAGSYQLQAYKNNSLEIWGTQIAKILKDEAAHQGQGAVEARRLAMDGDMRARLQEFVNFSLPMTVRRAFGTLDDAANSYCLDVGLKTMSTADVQYAYFESLDPIIRGCGLVYPNFSSQDVQLADPVKTDFGIN